MENIKQQRIWEFLMKDIKGLIAVGLIIVMYFYFREIATTLSMFLLLALIWEKLTRTWASQELMYQEIKTIKEQLSKKK